jgi:hypothetical protein
LRGRFIVKCCSMFGREETVLRITCEWLGIRLMLLPVAMGLPRLVPR